VKTIFAVQETILSDIH